jgi:hypothetical protein
MLWPEGGIGSINTLFPLFHQIESRNSRMFSPKETLKKLGWEAAFGQQETLA